MMKVKKKYEKTYCWSFRKNNYRKIIQIKIFDKKKVIERIIKKIEDTLIKEEKEYDDLENENEI